MTHLVFGYWNLYFIFWSSSLFFTSKKVPLSISELPQFHCLIPRKFKTLVKVDALTSGTFTVDARDIFFCLSSSSSSSSQKTWTQFSGYSSGWSQEVWNPVSIPQIPTNPHTTIYPSCKTHFPPAQPKSTKTHQFHLQAHPRLLTMMFVAAPLS